MERPTKRSAIEVTSYLTYNALPSAASSTIPYELANQDRLQRQESDNVVLDVKLVGCGEVANLGKFSPV